MTNAPGRFPELKDKEIWFPSELQLTPARTPHWSKSASIPPARLRPGMRKATDSISWSRSKAERPTSK